jgi:hypothetical protein
MDRCCPFAFASDVLSAYRKGLQGGLHRNKTVSQLRGLRLIAVLVRLSDDDEVAPRQWYLEAG